MTKRYGMKEGAERRSKTKKKKPSPYMQGVYDRLCKIASTPYEYPPKWGISPVKGTKDPLGQKK